MKAEVINKKLSFEPIEIKLVIENEDELKALWHRLNVSLDNVIKHSGESVSYPKQKYGFADEILWNILDNICIQRGLKN